MKLPSFLRRKSLALLLVGVCGLEMFAMTGCVVYPNGSEAVVLPPGLPAVNVGFYGTPAGYYYRNNPVYIYRGRHVYYYGGRRYWYGGYGHHYYYRGGYRYYY